LKENYEERKRKEKKEQRYKDKEIFFNKYWKIYAQTMVKERWMKRKNKEMKISEEKQIKDKESREKEIREKKLIKKRNGRKVFRDK